MSCTGSTYCLSNTGNSPINDNYYSAGTHNGNLYYTGDTNNLFIYYSSSNDEWCLSTALDGSCIMSGDSPGAPDCPDLSDFYFSSGMCPTPTPSPTPAVDCSSLDFDAIFDCDVTPTPSVSPTSTPTPTPTITPTSSDICGGTGIVATIESITPTPTPTPTITPTSSSPIVRPCVFSGDVMFNVIEGDIVCPYSYEFQDCYNGAVYLTTSQVSNPSGGDLEEFDIFNAEVNGESRCISFIKINLTEIGGDIISLTSGPLGKSNEGDCIYCQPSVSMTPTPTPTPTQTQTPTPTPTPTMTPDASPAPTPTMTPSPSPSPEPLYYVYSKCSDNGEVIGYLVQTSPGETLTPGEVQQSPNSVCWAFDYISVGYPNLPLTLILIDWTGNYFVNNPTVYPDCESCSSCEPDSVQKKIFSNKPVQVIKGNSNYHYVTFSNQSLGRYVIGDTQVDSVKTFTSPINLFSVVFNPTNEKIYLVSLANNEGFTIYDISTDSVTYEPLIPYIGLLGMVYNSINDSVYLLYDFDKVRIFNCNNGSITLLNNGELDNINSSGIQSVLYNPNENVIYYSAGAGNRLGVFDCNTQTSVTQYIGNFISSFNLDIDNNKLYIVTSSTLKEVECNSLVVSNLGSLPRSENGQSVFNPNNNKIYATDRGSSISIYDLNTNTITNVTGFIGNGSRLFGIVYDEDNDKIHACDYSNQPNGDVIIICPSE